jgi:hypothetical protein
MNDEDFTELVTTPILKAIQEVITSEELTTDRVMAQLSAEKDRNMLTRIALEPSPLSQRQNPRDCLNKLRQERLRRQLTQLRAKLARGFGDDSIAAQIQTLARRIENLGRIEKSA